MVDADDSLFGEMGDNGADIEQDRADGANLDDEVPLDEPLAKKRKHRFPVEMKSAHKHMVSELKQRPAVTEDVEGFLVFGEVFKPDLPNLPPQAVVEGSSTSSARGDAANDQTDDYFWMLFCSAQVRSQLRTSGEGGSGLGIEIVPEEEEEDGNLADEAERMRATIDAEFGWAGKKFEKNKSQQLRRASVQLSYLLLKQGVTQSDAKSEQQHAKIMALLFPQYRSHNEQLFRLRRGVLKRTPSMSMQDLEFFDSVCKHAQAMWLALSWSPFNVSPSSCLEGLSHTVHFVPPAFAQHAVRFRGDDSWCGCMANLISKLREEFNLHCASVLRSFHRWGWAEASELLVVNL